MTLTTMRVDQLKPGDRIIFIDVDALAEEILWDMAEAERRRNRVLSACRHCRRRLRVDPDMAGWALCARCTKLPRHTAEERLLSAIFADNPLDKCERCEANFASREDVS